MARIAEEEIERLKREVSLERLAEARGIKLKRHGADLIGLCSFHEDRSPSLVISPQKNLWNCLGACGKGGSVIDWLMRAEGISFRHAVELLNQQQLPLAAHPGTNLPQRSTVPKLPAPVSRDVDERVLLSQVTRYYHEAQRLPAGTSVTIVGITGKTFAQPYLLFKARLSADPGYFGEQLSRGRQQSAIAWGKRSGHLRPMFTETDILGVFQLASDLFSQHQNATRKVLILYSDMWQANSVLNLEGAKPLRQALVNIQDEKREAIPHLTNVEVYVLGAIAPKRTSAEWDGLRSFWTAYLKRSGARLICYSVFTDPPDLITRANSKGDRRCSFLAFW